VGASSGLRHSGVSNRNMIRSEDDDDVANAKRGGVEGEDENP
jgi:hypothetical protein